MKQLEMLYEGKAKQIFRTDDPERIIIRYKDTATAFNNIKKATIENKGVVNNAISSIIFRELERAGVKTHFLEKLNDRDQLCRRVTIIPLEVVVRNVIAGSMAQRLGIEEGMQPSNTIYDLCYKREELDFLDDITVENKQCDNLAGIYAGILTGMSDARVSVVSNNLAVIMKYLAVINVVFMPATVLTGLGGMSEFSMMTEGLWWPHAYSALVLVMVVVGYITYLLVKQVGTNDIGRRR